MQASTGDPELRGATAAPVPEPLSVPSPPPGAANVGYEFEQYRLDPQNRMLRSENKEVPLPGRAFDVLLMLVQHPGALLTKEELLAQVWRDSFVEESNLTVAISTLRRALNEDPQDRRFIQTVARRGYRFVAEVREVQLTAARPTKVAPGPTPIVAEPEAARPAVALEFPGAEEASLRAQTPHSAEESRLVHGTVLPALYGALLLLLGAIVWWLLKPGELIRSMAVLPFRADAGYASSQGGEYRLLGMTDGLVDRLGGQLAVRPTSAVLHFSEGNEPDAAAAGRELGVDVVLAGHIRGSGAQEAVDLRLVRVRDGAVLWRDTLPAPEDPAGLQAMASAVAGRLHTLHAIAAPPKLEPAPRIDAPAYQLYLRGRYFWNLRTEDGLHKSATYFKQSIDADPNFAPAYAGLADSYALLASFSVEPGRSANADARSAALSAIQLDPTLAEPHASLGMILFFTDWNLRGAEREFVRAIQLNPNYATAHHWYALDLAAMGRFPQAMYEIREAQKLDPVSLIIGTNVGWIEYLARDYPAATADLRRVLEMSPNFARARTRLGMVEMATVDYPAAMADFRAALELSGDEDPWVQGLLGDAEARAGDKAAAERELAALRSRAEKQYVPPISSGLVLLGLGRNAEAEVALAKAVDDHSTSMVYARVDPALDGLRQSPDFRRLTESLGR